MRAQVRDRLAGGVWGLARELAGELGGDKAAVRELVRVLFGEEVELRKRAADFSRRMTERDAGPLARYADELAGLLETLAVDESRTRWHLRLVVPRVVKTRVQRLRAARIMATLAEDGSNVGRCSAVEGMGLLAVAEASLREQAEAMVEAYLRPGTTPAMKSRARGVRKMLEKRYGEGLRKMTIVVISEASDGKLGCC